MQPAVDELAAKAEPTAKDVTHGVIRPGGAAFAEHAVPATKAVASERIEPAVDAVRVLDTCCTALHNKWHTVLLCTLEDGRR